MPSFRNILEATVLSLAAVASALPAQPKLSSRAVRAYDLSARQLASTGLPAGLGDVDILQLYVTKMPIPNVSNHWSSALTLEYLEAAFYQQGFAQFPASDFQALGLSQQQITDLLDIGSTEQVHVTTLLSAIAGVGTQPVAPCTYNFGFTTAQNMVATASILENIGVSA
jgi:hypothetical protein